MRKWLLLATLLVVLILESGCSHTSILQGRFAVDVTDTTGQVSPDDPGTALADLSGYWWFGLDGTLTIRNNWGQFLTGTYTFNGTKGSFTASYDTSADSRSDGVEVHISITGTLDSHLSSVLWIRMGSITGSGTYTSSYTASPTDQYSMSGDFTLVGTPPVQVIIFI